MPVGRPAADGDGADVDPLGGQLVQHERAGTVGADRGDEGDTEPEPRRGDGSDRRGPPDDHPDAAHQLLPLAEDGGHVVAEDEHVRIAVAEHHQVHVMR